MRKETIAVPVLQFASHALFVAVGCPKNRIDEVGQRACARIIDGGRARASALTYEDNAFRIASRPL
jgi:hypothetical protein